MKPQVYHSAPGRFLAHSLRSKAVEFGRRLVERGVPPTIRDIGIRMNLRAQAGAKEDNLFNSIYFFFG